VGRTLLLGIALWFFFASCASAPDSEETPLPSHAPVIVEKPSAQTPGAGGLPEEIRSLIETGVPPSLQASLDLIRNHELGNSEFGRIMNAVAVLLLKTIYPGFTVQYPLSDPPQTHSYAKILKDIEKGIYTPAPPNSKDFLEHVLPVLALYNEKLPEKFTQALPDLREAAELKPNSPLAPYLLGLALERMGNTEEAEKQYAKAWELSQECYPAALGLAGVMDSRGEMDEAVSFLSGLVIRFPDNMQVKRRLALAYYRAGDWSRAEPAVAEVLQRDRKDGEFILTRVHILLELGQYLQAQAPLDLYASLNPNNRFYLFLRARVQADGYHNRDAALNYLRSMLRLSSGVIDDDASVYAARLFMESSRADDQSEGRELLRRLLANPAPSLTVITLALEDAIRRQAWQEAGPYLARLLRERRSTVDLLNAYQVERGQGNNAAALSYARELYERDRSSEESISTYVSALIDTGRVAEAAGMIDARISGLPGGTVKGRYYYLRSRTRSDDDARLNDLRSSLFEDPRNLNALIAMFEIYHRRKDERRALYYLKQALAISPDNPRLKRYESEYAGL
jgi:tetratricopeptide (TPR) repeat protein